jgi:ATP-dependent protease ClpP protease subunit
MPKILQLKAKDKQGKLRNTGCIEIKNQTETSAELYFYGDIIGSSKSEDYKNYYPDDKCPKDIIDFLNEIGDVDKLDIHINSGGGSVFGGIAIYNQLKGCKAHKTVYVDGIAASIASVIACVGDKIIVPSNATFMIHKPMNGYFFTVMNADELRKDADVLDRCQEAIVNTYMGRAKEGVTRETIEELVNKETWLVGNEVTQYFDFEVEESSEAVACTSDYFDKYINTPKNLKKETPPTVNVNTDEIVEKLYAKLKKDTEPADQEQIKNKLLEDLYLYG